MSDGADKGQSLVFSRKVKGYVRMRRKCHARLSFLRLIGGVRSFGLALRGANLNVLKERPRSAHKKKPSFVLIFASFY